MFRERTAAQAKRLGVVTCNASDPLQDVVMDMADNDISGLVVVDGSGCVAGIITRMDLIRAHLQSPDWRQEPVEQYMTRNVITVKPATTLGEIMSILLENRIHRVVVAREEDGLCVPMAVISESDLIAEMANSL